MEFFSKDFWNKVSTKLVETFISVKIWILTVIIYFVNRLYGVGDEIRRIMEDNISNTDILSPLVSLQGKVYDIATSLIISGIVVIVLSRETFKHARLDQENEKEE